jgi:TonB family protein
MRSPLAARVIDVPNKRILSVVILLFLTEAFAQTNQGGLKVGGGVSEPGLLYAPNPYYSKDSRGVKYEGSCVLRLVVDTEGRPNDIRVVRPLGHDLDEKAIETVKQWKFRPAMKDGKPVAVQIMIEVHFRLYDNPDSDSNLQPQLNWNDVDYIAHFHEEEIGAQWTGKSPYTLRQLAELSRKCTPYINTKLVDL